MKIRILLITVFIFLGCDFNNEKNKNPSPSKSPPSQSVLKPWINPTPAKTSDLPSIAGLLITYSAFIKTKDVFTLENLEIRENHSGRVIDSYHLINWGPVNARFGDQSITVTPFSDSFTITYKSDNGRIKRSSQCQFKNKKIDENKLNQLLTDAKSKSPDLEKILNEIFNIAKSGNSRAFDFLTNPSLEQKQYLQQSKVATSIIQMTNAISFMLSNGCIW